MNVSFVFFLFLTRETDGCTLFSACCFLRQQKAQHQTEFCDLQILHPQKEASEFRLDEQTGSSTPATRRNHTPKCAQPHQANQTQHRSYSGLVRELAIVFVLFCSLDSSEHERSKHFVKSENDQRFLFVRHFGLFFAKGRFEPLIKVRIARKHFWHQIIEQSPQILQRILQRSSSKQKLSQTRKLPKSLNEKES